MSLNEQYTTKLTSITSKRQSIERYIATLARILPAGDMDNLPPRESAELSIAIAHSIVNCYLGYLACQGIDISKHSIRHEMERLESYLQKMSPAPISPPQKRGRSDAVVNRMVVHHLGGGLS